MLAKGKHPVGESETDIGVENLEAIDRRDGITRRRITSAVQIFNVISSARGKCRCGRRVLILAAEVGDPTSIGCPGGEAVDGVEALLIGPTEIIGDGLAEMIAVGKRCAGNLRDAGVDSFHAALHAAVLALAFDLVVKFGLQSTIDSGVFGFSGIHAEFWRNFTKQTLTFLTSPRTHTNDGGTNVAFGDEAIDGWINPAIKRNVRGAMIGGVKVAVVFEDGAEGAPIITAKLRIMVATINILGDEIAENASDENVGGEVLLAVDARVVDGCSEAIDDNFGEDTGIFVGNDAGDGPGGGSMFGRKGSAARKERAAAIALIGTLAAKSIFQGFRDEQAVERSFTSEPAGFAPVLAMIDVTEEPHTASTADEGANGSVGEILVTADGRGGMRKMTVPLAVGDEKSGSDTAHGKEPLGVGERKFCGTQPDGFLVE